MKNKDKLLNALYTLRDGDDYTKDQELVLLVKLGFINEIEKILESDDEIYFSLPKAIATHDETVEITKIYLEKYKENNIAKFDLLKYCIYEKNNLCIEYILKNNPIFHVAEQNFAMEDECPLKIKSIYHCLFAAVDKYKDNEFCTLLKQIIIQDDLFTCYFYGLDDYKKEIINTNDAIKLRKKILKKKFELGIENLESETDLKNNPHFDQIRLVNSIVGIETPNFFNDCYLRPHIIPVLDWLFELGFDVASCYYSNATEMHTFNDDMAEYFYTLPRANINYSEMVRLMNENDLSEQEIKDKVFNTAIKYRCLPFHNKFDYFKEIREKILFNLRMKLRSLREPKQATQKKVNKI